MANFQKVLVSLFVCLLLGQSLAQWNSNALFKMLSKTSQARKEAWEKLQKKAQSKNDYKARLGIDIVIPVKGEAGFIKVDNDYSDYFYLLYPPTIVKKGEKNPILIWLSGGPGCASTMAMLYENGPNMYNPKDKKFEKNPYSWSQNAHMLFIDQPIGTGFGHGKIDNMAQTEDDVRAAFLNFIKGFFKVHPELEGNDLYITGESYAGHYVPALGNLMYFYENNKYNLKGIAIGNGWTSPLYQQTSYADFAMENKDVFKMTQQKYDENMPLLRVCQSMYKSVPTNYQPYISSFCNVPFSNILLDSNGNPRCSYYNIDEPCNVPGCIPLDNQMAWLESAQVINQFQVDHPYVDCSDPVYTAMARIDMRTDAGARYIAPLLNEKDLKIKILVYNGDKDFICNYLSGLAWSDNLEWPGKDKFKDAKLEEVTMKDGTKVGQSKTYGKLTFLRVYGAGHLVPHDQPKTALYMINDFMGYPEQ